MPDPIQFAKSGCLVCGNPTGAPLCVDCTVALFESDGDRWTNVDTHTTALREAVFPLVPASPRRRLK